MVQTKLKKKFTLAAKNSKYMAKNANFGTFNFSEPLLSQFRGQIRFQRFNKSPSVNTSFIQVAKKVHFL